MKLVEDLEVRKRHVAVCCGVMCVCLSSCFKIC